MAKKTKPPVVICLTLQVQKTIEEPTEAAYKKRLNGILKAFEAAGWSVDVQDESEIGD